MTTPRADLLDALLADPGRARDLAPGEALALAVQLAAVGHGGHRRV